MIAIPTPPTDNLYKFVALFGLTILLSAGGLAVKLHIDLDNANRAIESRALVGLREADRLGRSTDEADRKQAVALADSIRRVADTVETSHDRLTERPSILMPSLLMAAVAGALISIIGFVLWYMRFQRYQDMIVQKQARESPPDAPAI